MQGVLSKSSAIPIKYINAFIVGIVTFFWSYRYWDNDTVSVLLMKPFVYRQLSLLSAKFFMLLGASFEMALVIVMVISGIYFYFTIRALAQEYYDISQNEITIMLLVLLGMWLFIYFRKPYDLLTAWLFTLAFYYIQTDWNKYYLLFPIICINRETAFLLILVFFIHTLREWKLVKVFVLLQIIVFGLISFLLRYLLAGHPGNEVWIEPVENLMKFITHPWQTLLHLSIGGLLMILVYKGWKSKPRLLRIAFVTILPLLILLYLMCGQAFEVRIFWEVYPVTALLILDTLIWR